MTAGEIVSEKASTKESFAARFSDWLNPIVVKELRQAVQSRFVVAALLVLLAIQIVAVGIYLITAGDPTSNFDAGRQVFMILFGIMLGVSMLFVPLYTGVRLLSERSETNLDLLFVTTIKPRSIIGGKLMAAVTLTILIFSACLPFLTFTYFLRGIDLPSMLVALTLGFVVIIVSSQIAILVACLPVNRAFKFMIGLAMLVIFLVGYSATLAFTSDVILRGTGSTIGDANFWQWVGILALVFCGLLGSFFVLSVALIMPLSANRALPVRLFLTTVWIISGAAAVLGSWVEATHDPLFFWQASFNAIFAISLFAAVSERDMPGRRVLRDVPRFGLKRTMSFFFFSGSASGLAWATVMTTVTYVVCWIWWRLFPDFSNTDDLIEVTRWFTVMNLFLFCYVMTGALLRRHLLTRVGVDLTWLIGVALVGIGSSVPFLIGMLFFVNNVNWWQTDYGRWLVGNPFVWDIEAHRGLYLSVGVIWAVLVIAFNLHWFIDRVRMFSRVDSTVEQ